MMSTVILYIPNVLAALLIIGIGYPIEEGVARAVNKLIDKTLEPTFDRTDIGRVHTDVRHNPSIDPGLLRRKASDRLPAEGS